MKMRNMVGVCVLLLLFMFFFVDLGNKKAEASMFGTDSEHTETCVTGDCHNNMGSGVSVHKPVKEGACVSCHRVISGTDSAKKNPHPGNITVTLYRRGAELCSTCHPSEGALADKALNKHGPMADEKGCVNCHNPHFSNQAKLLILPQQELCLSCHDKELTTEMGTLKDLKAFLAANKGGQGPLKDKPCSTCHNPHGSDYWRLLVKYYSSNFYASYSDSKYALCFSCHEKTVFTKRHTQKLTQFRDGERNLHYVHVNKMTKGRSCRACHETCSVCESTGQPKHIKETVGFSYWSLPMNFIPSKNGGSCAPGCHGEKMYSR